MLGHGCRSQEPDSRGERIEEWISDCNLHCVNDGSPTRTNRATGNHSTPDVFLAPSQWLNKVGWTTLEDIGGSDHLPGMATVHCKWKSVAPLQRLTRWKKNADLSAFSQILEEKIETLKPQKTIDRIKAFHEAVVAAATETVPKTAPGKKPTCHLSASVKVQIKTRNRLRRSIGTNRKEWIEACRSVRQKIEEERQKSWESFVQETEFSCDPSKLWRVFHAIGDSSPPTQPNEALLVKSKVLHSDRQKADAFAKYYAQQSKLTFTKEERDTNRASKKLLQTATVSEECSQDFTEAELKKGLRRMRTKGTAGPDEITPAFIKAFGPAARKELLDLFNRSWNESVCPQVWRNATIIPLLKPGKPASEMSSFRPISLTSCIAKLLERLIATRMMHIVESRKLLSKAQCGGRRNRCCEDLLLRITQAISNGFQSKRPKKTVMVLFDYSKAFDTVWRQQLLIRLANKGIPMKFVKWFAAFLTNRQAKVLFGSTKSKSVEIKQGVPQGSVVAPLLFLLFIDDITKDVPANHALFIDDLSIWTTDRDKPKTIVAAQNAIDHITAWSRKNKLGLNLSKCETATFSSGSVDANWKPRLTLDGKPVPFNATPKLVGVKLDRTLSFGPHVKDVTQKIGKRTNLLKAVGSREWGWKKKTLRKVYVSTQRSVLDYAGAAWHPYLSNTQFQKLETAQNKALRAITGHCSSTPIEALRLESGIPSYRTQSNRLIAVSHQKAIRRDQDHPMTAVLQDNVPQRLKRGSWATKTNELRDYLPPQAQSASNTSSPLPPPWSGKHNNWKVSSTVLGQNKTVSADEVNALIDSHNCPLVIYTDGSASAGIEKGGYAAIFT